MTMVATMAETFGEWIREEREKRRFTARECAYRAGMKEPVWSNLENDRSRRNDGEPSQPRPDTLRKIARGLEVDEWRVFEAAGYTPPIDWLPQYAGAANQPRRDAPTETRELHDDLLQEVNELWHRFKGEAWFEALSDTQKIAAVNAQIEARRNPPKLQPGDFRKAVEEEREKKEED